MQTSFCIIAACLFFKIFSHVICISFVKLFDLTDKHSLRGWFWLKTATERPQAYVKTSLLRGAWGFMGNIALMTDLMQITANVWEPSK